MRERSESEEVSLGGCVILSAFAVLAGLAIAFCIKMNWLDSISQLLGRIFGWQG